MPFFVQGEKILLKKDGTWIADGIEITHEETRKIFYKSIHWDSEQKKYYLEIGYERLFIEVEDTPYFVTELERTGKKIFAKLSSTVEIEILATNLLYVYQHPQGVLYLMLPENERARFLSASYYDLLKDLTEDENGYFLTIVGERVCLLSKSLKI